MYGPHICGDAIDFRSDGHTMLTGSYRQSDVLELWDIRTYKKFRTIDWDGPKSMESNIPDLVSNNKESESEDEEEKENIAPLKDNKPAEKVMGFNRYNPAPFIYSAQFNNATNVVMAAGAGCNQVRLFDYDTGNIVC